MVVIGQTAVDVVEDVVGVELEMDVVVVVVVVGKLGCGHGGMDGGVGDVDQVVW